MKMNGKHEKNNTVKSVMKGISIFVCMTIFLCAVSAKAITGGLIKEEYLQCICVLVLLISSFMGSMAAKGSGEKGGVWTMLLIGVVYSVVLGITGFLIFHNTLKNTAVITTSIIAGSLITLFFKCGKGKERKRAKTRYR